MYFTESTSPSNSDSETDSDNVFYSAYGKTRPKKQLASAKTFVDVSSVSSLKLNIQQAVLTMYAPVRVSLT